MTRLARMVASGLPHHVTQRGNRREPIFFQDGDQEIYRDLLGEQVRKAEVEVWAYCLMPNHVHLILNPRQADGLSPDPYTGSYDLTTPQSMNRYAYVLNNPMSMLDPSGLVVICDETGCHDCDSDDTACASKGGDCVANGTEGCITASNPGTATSLQPTPSAPSSGSSGAPNNGFKAKVCSAIPSGRTQGASGGLGGVGSVGGGGELVFNYNSGQVSAFGFGGVQVGWNGGASGSIYTGFVYGLNSSNSNYSGGFTGFNVGDGLGIFGASSSGGLTGGTGGLAPNGAVTAGGISLGGGLLGGLAGGATATNYTNPLQLGKLWAFDPLDALLYAARQLCN